MSKASLEDVYLDILQECREAEEAEEDENGLTEAEEDADDNLTADSKENEAEGGEES